MLTQIVFFFPVATKLSQEFFSSMKMLFSELPSAVVEEEQITLTASNPKGAFPEIVLRHTEEATPFVSFVFTKLEEEQINDVIRSFFVTSNSNSDIQHISLAELSNKIKGHLIRVDHLGFNIPSSQIAYQQWRDLLHTIAKTTTIYNYPTGEEWPFILPSTTEEFQSDIKDFCIGREPKFELVYDKYTSLIVFQFDIETDLKREEVEKMFPDPIGISFSGLEDFFRAVYVSSPWNGIQMRFDIRLLDNGSIDNNNWKTGKWLVEEGKRIK
jgi:hypothetical protein